MKIIVDGAKCQGNARCWAQDKDMFELDDEGYLPTQTITVPDTPEKQLAARRAVRACPERALTLED